MDGFLLVDKAGGMTSHDVVAMARKKLDTKKVGHAGTLDPMATGVLVLGIGIATRLLTYITDGKKAYQGKISLGSATHTDDKEGDVIFTAPENKLQLITDSQIKEQLAGFVGNIKQRPSSVSAIKIDGKSAHARVRAGEDVDIPERDITIDEIEVKQISHLASSIEIDLSVTCSAGTYIRAIARDLGEKLEVGGHLTQLRRTLVSPFTLEQCKDIADAQLISIAEVIEKLFPIRRLDFSESREILFGRTIDQNQQTGVVAALDAQGEFLALLENKAQGSKIIAAPILVKANS
ncbi:MAG: tRNA pseudouridine(55) synthase TruB [Candidatus Nanopelagicus sp.]|jgi:tRNA pseudouridine55 synthase